MTEPVRPQPPWWRRFLNGVYKNLFSVPSLGLFASELIRRLLIEPNQAAIDKFFEPITSNRGIIIFQVGSALATILLGTLLYYVRCRWIAWYARLEIFFGLFTAVFIVNQLTFGQVRGAIAVSPTISPFFAELAALYVIVRGYDNYYKSLKDDAKSRWKTRFHIAE